MPTLMNVLWVAVKLRKVQIGVHSMKRTLAACVILMLASWPCRADGPADNLAENVRRVPALGVEVSESERQALTQKLDSQRQAIDAVRSRKPPARIVELLPDVEIFHRAVHEALAHREFFNEKELPVARELLEQGL